MANENVPAPAPIISDDQILPFAAWVHIRKRNFVLDLQKKQKNPIFHISVDILQNTNFFRAFTTSASVPTIYIISNLLEYTNDKRQRLELTAHQFVSPLSGDAIMDFVNELRKHNLHQRSESPLHLAEEDLRLGNLKFVPKGEDDEVFGMPIPNELIINNIRNAPYYNAYLEMVAKHDQKIAAEKGGKKKPVTAKQLKPKPVKEKSSKPTPLPKPKISVDILQNTNFFRAFTALASVPTIYIQQFWNTLTYEAKNGAYSFKLDETRFVLDANILREALEITPIDQAHQFVSPPSGDAIMDFMNELGYTEEIYFVSKMAVNNMYQPWRATLSMINQCLAGKTSGPTKKGKKDKPHVTPYCRFTKLIIYHLGRKHNLHLRFDSPLHLVEEDLCLGNLKFVPKAEKEGKKKPATAKKLKPKPVKEKSSKPAPAPKPKGQEHVGATEEASTGSSAQPQDDTSANIIRDSPSPADAETGEYVENQANLEEKTAELDKGQAKSNPGRTPESRPLPEQVFMDEDQAGPDLGESCVALAGPNLKPTHDEFMANVYPNVHESLKFPADEHVILEDPLSSFGTLSSMKNLDDAYTIGDQFLNDKSTEYEPGKLNVEAEVVSMVTVPIYQASSSVPPLSTPVIDLSPPKPVPSTTQAPIFTATTATTTTTLPPPPQQQSTTDSELAARVTALKKKISNFEQKGNTLDNTTQNLGSRVFTLKLRDLSHKINQINNEVVKEVVHVALQAPLRDRFRELPEDDMKEILHQRMFKSGTYKSLPKHVPLYEALEASMERANRDEFFAKKDKSRKRRRDDQDPPPLPDSDLSKKRRHASDASGLTQPPDPQSSAWKTCDTREALSRSSGQKFQGHRYCTSSQVKDQTRLVKACSRGRKTSNSRTRLDWQYDFIHQLVLQTDWKEETKQSRLRRPSFQVDLVNPEGHRVMPDVRKPLPLGGSKERRSVMSISKLKAANYPNFRLEELVPSL
ncbi:hypothetical protein Tco_1133906 [Tanacetum coccineum]